MNDIFDEIWSTDLLNRRADAEFLTRFLSNRLDERGELGIARSYVLNIEADWGQGKSFFLDRFREHLQSSGHLVACVNAWRDDHADDPLLAVMSAIDDVIAPLIERDLKRDQSWKAIKKNVGAITLAVGKGAVQSLANRYLADAVDEIKEIVSEEGGEETADSVKSSLSAGVSRILDQTTENLLADFKESQNSIGSFRCSLEEFLKVGVGKKATLPLFVFVDELDRCRPAYAIAMLERVKHLFDIDNVVFVFATNTIQLRHAVSPLYGTAFDAQKYLFRFFDRTYHFEDPAPEEFVAALVARAKLDVEELILPPHQEILPFLVGMFTHFGLSLRDIEQCFDILRSILTVWEAPTKLQGIVLLPQIVAHQQGLSLGPTKKFIDDLIRLSANKDREEADWQFQFPRGPFGNEGENTYTGIHILRTFLTMAEKSLPEAAAGGGQRGTVNQWVGQLLGAEFRQLHHATYDGNNPPYSLVTQYPEFVRSAGRLTPSLD